MKKSGYEFFITFSIPYKYYNNIRRRNICNRQKKTKNFDNCVAQEEDGKGIISP